MWLLTCCCVETGLRFSPVEETTAVGCWATNRGAGWVGRVILLAAVVMIWAGPAADKDPPPLLSMLSWVGAREPCDMICKNDSRLNL